MGQAEDSESQLINAANRGDVATVLQLVGVGVNVNAKDSTGVTALTQAAWGGHSEIVRILLVSGADPDAKDDRADMTPLMWAVWKGYAETVETLLENGASVLVADKNARTALMGAAWGMRSGADT